MKKALKMVVSQKPLELEYDVNYYS